MHLQERLLHQIFGLSRCFGSVAEQVPVEPRGEQIVEITEGAVIAAGVTIHGRVGSTAGVGRDASGSAVAMICKGSAVLVMATRFSWRKKSARRRIASTPRQVGKKR